VLDGDESPDWLADDFRNGRQRRKTQAGRE